MRAAARTELRRGEEEAEPEGNVGDRSVRAERTVVDIYVELRALLAGVKQETDGIRTVVMIVGKRRCNASASKKKGRSKRPTSKYSLQHQRCPIRKSR